jgi:hypothetical protein
MKCDTKGCRNEMIMIHLNKRMCELCWQKKCQQDAKEWSDKNGEDKRKV